MEIHLINEFLTAFYGLTTILQNQDNFHLTINIKFHKTIK
jgi:hypothetical protein